MGLFTINFELGDKTLKMQTTSIPRKCTRCSRALRCGGSARGLHIDSFLLQSGLRPSGFECVGRKFDLPEPSPNRPTKAAGKQASAFSLPPNPSQPFPVSRPPRFLSPSDPGDV